MAAVSAEGSTVWVLMRRLNSSCDRSMMFVERAPFHLARRQASEGECAGLLEAVGNRALLEPAIYDRRAERCAAGLSSAGISVEGTAAGCRPVFFWVTNARQQRLRAALPRDVDGRPAMYPSAARRVQKNHGK